MKAYERLLKYVQYPTGSDENSETCPSTPEQLVLGAAGQNHPESRPGSVQI